jgi:hypothetical protein
MSFGWWTILDTHEKLLSMKKASSIAVLDTLKPVRLPTTIPRSKALKSPTEWHTYTIHVSIVSKFFKNPYLTCLLPFIYNYCGPVRLS